MSVFTVHTIVQRDGTSVAFAPGDELPDWAADQVGAHCLDSAEAATDGESVDVADVEVKPSAKSKDAAPDFTAPAPRRGRPRK